MPPLENRVQQLHSRRAGDEGKLRGTLEWFSVFGVFGGSWLFAGSVGWTGQMDRWGAVDQCKAVGAKSEEYWPPFSCRLAGSFTRLPRCSANGSRYLLAFVADM